MTVQVLSGKNKHEAALEDALYLHAGWVIRYWYRDYDMYAPYFIRLTDTLLGSFKGYYRWTQGGAYRMLPAPTSQPTVGEVLEAVGYLAELVGADRYEVTRLDLEDSRTFVSECSTIGFGMCRGLPGWAIDCVFAAVAEAARVAGTHELFSAFVAELERQLNGRVSYKHRLQIEQESIWFRHRFSIRMPYSYEELYRLP